MVRGGAKGDRGGAVRRVLVRRRAHREPAAADPALLPPLGGQRAGGRPACHGLCAPRAVTPLQHGRVPDLRPAQRAARDQGSDARGRRRRRLHLRPRLRRGDRRSAARRAARHDPRVGPLRLHRATRGVPRRSDRLPAVSDGAVAALRAGRAVILPTDTVYGLCALREHKDVLYELKGRDPSKPVALLAADVDTLVAAVPGLDPSVLEQYLPGPYTLIVGGVGIRVPSLPPAAADVVRAVGVVAATSANLSGGPDPRRGEEIPEEIRGACGGGGDGGERPGPPPPVVALPGGEVRTPRGGAGPPL